MSPVVNSQMPRALKTTALSAPQIADVSVRRDRSSKLPLQTGDTKILLVDDDPTVLQLCEVVLISAGYSVCAVSSAGRAMDLFRQEPLIELLLTDIQMPPGISGLELAVMMALERPSLPVVVMSGALLAGNDARLIRERCWSFIDKPISVPRLLSVISILLRNARIDSLRASRSLPKAG